MPKNIIRKLAERGQLGRAVDALLDLADRMGDKYLRHDASSLSGRFYALQSDKNAGTVTSEQLTIRANGIRNSLYSILEDLPDMADDAYDLPSLRKVNFDYSEPAAPGGLADPPATQDQVRILIFTANTGGETQLDLSDEYARIREMLDNEGLNDRCQLKRIRLVTPEAIMENILEYEPHIVHFSGHGVRQRDPQAAGGSNRGFGEEEEENDLPGSEEGIETASDGALIVHNGANYSSFQIGADFLTGVFDIVKDDELPTHTVIFNACHSEAISGGVAEYIENVIATNNAIGDRAAISFSSTFYSRLIANDTTPEKAFKAARVVTIAYGEPKNRFVFYKDGKKKMV